MLQPKQTPKEKKNTKDATKMKNMNPVFKGPNSKLPQPKPSYTGGSPAKNGKTMKKAQGGTSLGMKSVKAGYDHNSGVTRADFVSIGKGEAKNGTKMKMGGKMKKSAMHKMPGGSMMKNSAMMKSGGTMKTCKGGC